MIPVQHQITFFVPEAASTWAQRMEAACAVLENAFPGEALLTANSQRERQRPATFAKGSYEELAATLSHELGGANAEQCDNHICVHTLIAHEPVSAASGGLDFYFQWPPGDRLEPLRGSWEQLRAWRAAHGATDSG
jgi:hypothetical protein